MPLNPNSMTSVTFDKQLDTFVGGVHNTLTEVRTIQSAAPAKDWSFGGVIRTKAHYDGLVYWAKKSGKVRVTDHLGRTFEVLIRQFDPEDRKPTGTVAWRLQYTMKTLLLRRVS